MSVRIQIRRTQSVIAPFCLLVFAVVSPPSSAVAIELEGFAEPFRTINVASDETGTIDDVLVREGESVNVDQPLIRLNCDVHLAVLAIAEQNMRAAGRLDAARADLELRRERLKKLQSLRAEGHARQEEVDRAGTETLVAEATVRTAQEDLLTRRLEYEKIKAQIARRTVRAPIAGIISKLHKDQGEYVAPNNPHVLTIVQIDTLLANFTLMPEQLANIRIGQQLQVLFLSSNLETAGVVELVSPVTDAESGSILVKIRIANPEGTFRSGERCKIQVEN